MMLEGNGRNVNSFNIHGGQLVVVASRPSMGKSLFMLNQVKYLCGEKGKNVLVFSLEEPKESFVKRLIPLCGDVNQTKMHSGNLNDDLGNIIDASKVIFGWDLVIYDDIAPTIELLCEEIRVTKKEKGISVAFIDYIQLVGCNYNVKSRNEEISYIMSELKNVAMELDIPIVVLSQLSRTCEKREDHRPVLMDIREPALRDENADMVLLLYREGYYRSNPSNSYGFDPMDAEVIVAKYPNMQEIPVTIPMRFSAENGWY